MKDLFLIHLSLTVLSFFLFEENDICMGNGTFKVPLLECPVTSVKNYKMSIFLYIKYVLIVVKYV